MHVCVFDFSKSRHTFQHRSRKLETICSRRPEAARHETFQTRKIHSANEKGINSVSGIFTEGPIPDPYTVSSELSSAVI